MSDNLQNIHFYSYSWVHVSFQHQFQNYPPKCIEDFFYLKVNALLEPTPTMVIYLAEAVQGTITRIRQGLPLVKDAQTLSIQLLLDSQPLQAVWMPQVRKPLEINMCPVRLTYGSLIILSTWKVIIVVHVTT